ncbi:MAG: hypothetical protein ACRCWR_13150 [Saezia sp.]
MFISIGESGKRVGKCHQRAKLTNDEVELIRQLHEEGLSYRELSEKFGVNRWHIGRLCRYERRAACAVRVLKRKD